ncbi:DNA-formamidopyrimidine glycosylase family protein [Myceligenerans pegani]|uniref:Fpg/Nei family DNA glycosylase n=1 Tax=Myceligenerans pegani TaxID=2776917 RepID=A0ABR9MU04_9MICO|nr:DNA-formamidopyrimidine glycosylase family protein [Myceligenerans sp. TRM 65318]MBE1874506.1 Fpg/Nei family DNA glycosylase [Myceligenerans sp. TRM 65318]MBE3016777.1 Fpg/Nei family DNA glycosylase [Myceligenerans sp. TRM 65318]
MPELPEVEALVRFLGERTAGRTVAGIEVGGIAALKTVDPPVTALAGGAVRGWTRHGKWLDMSVSDSAAPDEGMSDEGMSDDGGPGGPLHLVFHLARGGWVRWSDQLPRTPVRPRLGGAGKGAITALRVRFDDGSGFDLTEAGTRKRLAVHVVRRPDDVAMVASLGVEPLDPAFTTGVLAGLLAARNQQVKGLLREQSAIAGIGNAYSDEILHAARFSPYKLTRSFTEEETVRLHSAIGQVLAEAIRAASGKPAKELKDAKRAGMRVHGRTGAPCPGWDGTPCGDTVHEVSFADRSLQYCPTCQTNGQILADRRLSRLLK